MLRILARNVIHRLGIVPAIRTLKCRGCRILVYHRFPADRSKLAAQCEHIRRHYQPVSMRRVAESFTGGAPLPSHAVAVTVDDGYRDFLWNGQPVFSQFGIPVTVFLITSFIDREIWPWWDQITYMFNRTRRTAISFEGRELKLDNDLVRVVDTVTRTMKRLPANFRDARIDELRQDLDVKLPEDVPPEFEPLTWDEVRQLSSIGVEFGAHTRTHPILSLIQGETELSGEIAGSKHRLDEQVGIPSLHFAYPNGTPADYNDRTVASVQEAGFATAVVLQRAFNYPGEDRYRLARLDADPSLPDHHLIESLAGIRKF